MTVSLLTEKMRLILVLNDSLAAKCAVENYHTFSRLNVL